MTYLAAVIADAPVHFWRLADPGGGVARDIGSNRYDLRVPNGGSAPVPWHYSGPCTGGASALVLNGAYLARTLPVIATPYSVELCFYYVDTPIAGGNNDLIHIRNVGATDDISISCFQAVNLVAAQNTSRGISTIAVGQNRLNWQHFVLTDDGVTVTSYSNAIANPTAASAGAGTMGGGGLAIGGQPPTGGTASGAFIAEVALYNVALAPGRVTAHFVQLDTLTITPQFEGQAGSTSSDLSQLLAYVSKIFENAP